MKVVFKVMSYKLLAFALVTLCLCSCTTNKDDTRINSQPASITTESNSEEVSIYADIDGTVFEIELEDNRTAHRFIDLLPVQFNMTELNGNEKYIYIDEKLPANQSIPDTIHAGDIKLYGNNCIVLFYKTFTTQYSYTSIGHIKECQNLENVVGNSNIICKIYCE